MRIRVVLLGSMLLACQRPAPAPPAPPASPDTLFVDPGAARRDNPSGARKIAESALSYFRFTNRPFVDLVCTRYADVIAAMPMIPLHGDAHLERYAVGPSARGLSDFDGAVSGPPVVDLARFATSLVLATRDEPGARGAIEALSRGYERALDDPRVQRTRDDLPKVGQPAASAAEPSVVSRLRFSARAAEGAWLERVERALPREPVDPATWSELAAQLHERDPSPDPGYWRAKTGGRLAFGFGTPRHETLLVRVEGPSAAPEDDVVLDVEAAPSGAVASCVRGNDVETIRAWRAQAPPGPERFLGAVTLGGTAFFVHLWSAPYTALRADDVRSAAELAEIAEDVGRDLGRAHLATGGVPDQERRAGLKKALAAIRPGLSDTAVDFAGRTARAWRAYLRDSNQVGWTRGSRAAP